MKDIDLMRIEIEHEETKKEMVNPLCPRCGEPTISSTIEIDYYYTDRWGGVCGGGKKDVSVWKCPNKHISHIVMME